MISEKKLEKSEELKILKNVLNVLHVVTENNTYAVRTISNKDFSEINVEVERLKLLKNGGGSIYTGEKWYGNQIEWKKRNGFRQLFLYNDGEFIIHTSLIKRILNQK